MARIHDQLAPVIERMSEDMARIQDQLAPAIERTAEAMRNVMRNVENTGFSRG